jgi:transcriptional regulator with XRE-family HTH domain
MEPIDRLKKIRNEMGLTQEEFAKPLGLNRDNIASLESGKVKIFKLHGLALESVYKIDLKWFMEGEGDFFLKEKSDEKHTDPHIKFKDRLRVVIKNSNLTREDFAQISGVSRAQLFKYLKGDQNPGSSFYRNLKLNFSWVDLNWLIAGIENVELGFKDKKRAQRNIQNLIFLEKINKEVFKNIEAYIEGSLNCAKIMSGKEKNFTNE